MPIARRKNGGFALVPERVSADQKHWDTCRKPFSAVPCDALGKPIPGAKAVMMVLRGDLYGLHTTGTGDMVVAQHRYERKKV